MTHRWLILCLLHVKAIKYYGLHLWCPRRLLVESKSRAPLGVRPLQSMGLWLPMRSSQVHREASIAVSTWHYRLKSLHFICRAFYRLETRLHYPLLISLVIGDRGPIHGFERDVRIFRASGA